MSESIYPCTCTRADIERAASAPHLEDEGPTYPGTCSHRRAAEHVALGDRPFAWRFRVPPDRSAGMTSFLGRVELEPSRTGGDFVVARQGAGHSYQLAVVADDDAMGVNQVIRGDRPGGEHAPADPALSPARPARATIRTRLAGRHARRPTTGQARRLAQARRLCATVALIHAAWSAR